MSETGSNEPFAEPRVFSLSQRVGRVRYLVYVLIGILACSAMLLPLYFICLMMTPPVAALTYQLGHTFLLKILMPMVVFVMTIRRLHDIDLVGWWSLLIVIPFLTAVLLFVKGSPGGNRFGPPPKENGPGLNFLAIGLPLVLFSLFFAFKDKPRMAGMPGAIEQPGGIKGYRE